MSNGLISLLTAASLGALAYKKLGPRIGYGNSQQIRAMVAIIFIFSLVVMYTFVRYVLHLS